LADESIWGSFLAAVLLIAARKRRYLIAMLLSNTSAWIFIETAKNLVGRVRPPVENAIITEQGFAFLAAIVIMRWCFTD